MDGINDSVDMNLSKLWETVKDRVAWHAVVYGAAESNMMYELNNNNYTRAVFLPALWKPHAALYQPQ